MQLQAVLAVAVVLLSTLSASAQNATAAEPYRVDDAQLAKMMPLARKGIESLVSRQQAVLTGLPLRQ